MVLLIGHIDFRYDSFGLFAVLFFVDGNWQGVIIDDQLPTRENKLVFGKCEGDFMWLPLVEKAYAKLYGGYDNIILGLVHESLKDLTGGIAEEIKTPGLRWATLVTYSEQGYLMGCGNPKSGSGNFDVVHGIVQGHAYSILNVREVEGACLVKLRNPWGQTEYEGDWSASSPQMTAKMKALLAYSGNQRGEFWMSFEDFCFHFQRVFLCRVFTNVYKANVDTCPLVGSTYTWFQYEYATSWFGRSAQGAPTPQFLANGSCPEDNPQWAIRTERLSGAPSYVLINLVMPTKLNAADYLLVAMVVVDKRGKRVRTLKKTEIVAGQLSFSPSRELTLEIEVDPSQELTIFPCTLRPRSESPFQLNIFSKEAMIVRELDETDGYD